MRRISLKPRCTPAAFAYAVLGVALATVLVLVSYVYLGLPGVIIVSMVSLFGTHT